MDNSGHKEAKLAELRPTQMALRYQGVVLKRQEWRQRISEDAPLFSEFLWADYFRRRISAASPQTEAAHLPDWSAISKT